MSLWGHFLFILVLMASLEAFGGGVNCPQYEGAIHNKIEARYAETKAINAGKISCDDAEYAKVTTEYRDWMNEHCRKLVEKAVATCGQVEYRAPASNTGNGTGGTGVAGTNGVTQATDDLRLQGRQCGEALSPIPASCHNAAEIGHRIFRESNCSPEQVEQFKIQSAPNAKKGIQAFCRTLANHYEQTKANLKAQSVARKNFRRTNKQTHKAQEK